MTPNINSKKSRHSLKHLHINVKRIFISEILFTASYTLSQTHKHTQMHSHDSFKMRIRMHYTLNVTIFKYKYFTHLSQLLAQFTKINIRKYLYMDDDDDNNQISKNLHWAKNRWNKTNKKTNKICIASLIMKWVK